MSYLNLKIKEVFEQIKADKNLQGEIIIEKPRDEKNGNFSTNFGLINAKKNNKVPMDFANELKEELTKYSDIFSQISVAKPGFINMNISNENIKSIISEILTKKAQYGMWPKNNFKYNLELVSANPTGYLHVGHARNGAIGDSTARILRAAGYEVETEYYTNDAGNQINVAASTLFYHYKGLQNDYQLETPTEMYGGDMYAEVAKNLVDEFGDKYMNLEIIDNKISDPQVHEIFKQKSISLFMKEIKQQLKDFGVDIQLFTSEASVYANHDIEKMLELYKSHDKVYELEDALWLKTTEFGDDKDRVLVKANGDYTYITPDIACHNVRFNRSKANKYVNFWGGDHHGYIKRINAGLALLGHEEGLLDIDMIQMVRLIKDGAEMKMSKRRGTAVWLIDLLEMVGKDSLRYFLLSKAPSSHMDFDIDVALQKNSTNPIYYINYATARCNNVLKKAKDNNIKIDSTIASDLLVNEKELNLAVILDSFDLTIKAAAEHRLPNIICDFTYNLAKKFHSYYAEVKIIDEDNLELSKQRIAFVEAIYIVLSNALELLGIDVVNNM
ncbi:arginine--tRNA ligase [Spiroplasma culicicola]|uniref:Arginine--tRNA ligase n=1 Tax=Spiroplasma culicicola AES-1 TaxID=1276246 RepID=W6A6M7_9MOLU|nr:arginine--tRNA ligase [Spiroplasma culicicola]AHI52530.1 arginyl-tRNA synthetase [Spiroplasma culicicola AES-1]